MSNDLTEESYNFTFLEKIIKSTLQMGEGFRKDEGCWDEFIAEGGEAELIVLDKYLFIDYYNRENILITNVPKWAFVPYFVFNRFNKHKI